MIKNLILVTFIGTTLVTHFRGRVRLKFARQLFDHSTFMSPVNNFMYLFSKVPNTPYLNKQYFPELEIFDKNWEIIKKEAMELVNQGYITTSDSYDDAGFNSFFRKGWKRFYLKWYGVGFLKSAQKFCPKTVELIKQVPNLNGAMFTYLPAGSKLVKHRDPYAGSLRYHLGLSTPNSDDCYILVDGEKYSWRDGDSVIFDETYVHEAHNKTTTDRLIFFCDIKRPMCNALTNWLNDWLSYLIMAGSATKNIPGEHIGWVNKAFAYIYQIRIIGSKLKKYNRKLYKALKYSLFAGILYSIFFIL